MVFDVKFLLLCYASHTFAQYILRKEPFMKKITCCSLLLSLLILAGCVCTTQQSTKGNNEIKILTEEYPPVTFMKDGKVTGFVTDVVRAIITRQGIADNIKLTSWDEAYNVALHNPNVVIFSTERTEKREKLFQWVGPVGKNSAIFFAKKGSGIKIKSLEDAKKIAAIATTTNWFTEQYLKDKGFKNLVSSPLPATSVQHLMNGKAQVSIFTDITMPEIVKKAGYSMDDLEPVFTVSSTYFYIAVSLGTPDETVRKWQSILYDLKADGTFEKIYRSYIPNADLHDLIKR